jgi:O-antigen ligase
MAHNSYLENAYEFGLPAAAVFYTALALIAARLVRGARTRRRDTDIAAFAIGCLAAGAFHAAFDFSLQMPAAAALFAAILGLGWAQSFTREEIDPARARRRRKRQSEAGPRRADGPAAAARRVSRA